MQNIQIKYFVKVSISLELKNCFLLMYFRQLSYSGWSRGTRAKYIRFTYVCVMFLLLAPQLYSQGLYS